MTLESRMENILRTNVIRKPAGKYKAALNRLVTKGKAKVKQNTYALVGVIPCK